MPTDPCLPDSSCTLAAGFAAGYDKASNRLFERHLHSECRSHVYTHDKADRLTRYQRGKLAAAADPLTPPTISRVLALPGAWSDFQYGLDAAGNWATPSYTPAGGAAVNESRTYNTLNQATQVATASLTYDGNGNLTYDGRLTYKYDVLNRLKQVLEGTTVLATYWYDALGRRVKRDVPAVLGGKGGVDRNVTSGATLFLYAGEQCVEERDAGSGTTQRQYVWGQYVDELVQQREGVQDYYPLSDLTWRTAALTDKCGFVVEAYDADAYGRTQVFAGPGADGTWFTEDDARQDGSNGNRPFPPRCRYLFTGREFDAESGLHFYRARHLHPTLGRFLQRDPLGYDAGDANLYAYCQGNPLIHTDPSGELIWFLAIPLYLLIAGATVGAVHGIAETHAANPNAGVGDYVTGGALGTVFGALNPVGEFVSAGGAVVGGLIQLSGGGEFLGAGFQLGGLAGTLAGGFSSAARQGFRQAAHRATWWMATRAAARAGVRAVGWESVGAVSLGLAGAWAEGSLEGAAHYANWGMFSGGIIRSARSVSNLIRDVRRQRQALQAFEKSTGRVVPEISFEPYSSLGAKGKTNLRTGRTRIASELAGDDLISTIRHENIHRLSVPKSEFLAAMFIHLRERHLARAFEEFAAEWYGTRNFGTASHYTGRWIRRRWGGR